MSHVGREILEGLLAVVVVRASIVVAGFEVVGSEVAVRRYAKQVESLALAQCAIRAIVRDLLAEPCDVVVAWCADDVAALHDVAGACACQGLVDDVPPACLAGDFECGCC